MAVRHIKVRELTAQLQHYLGRMEGFEEAKQPWFRNILHMIRQVKALQHRRRKRTPRVNPLE